MPHVEKHPHFDLWLHRTDALAEALGVGIVSRQTIHEWPLSCVQRIVLRDGTFMIYKAQKHATVEPEFYRRARSRLLPGHRYLGQVEGCEAMVFEYISSPRLVDLALDAAGLLALGGRMQREISAIEGDVPVFTDIGTVDKWRSFADTTLAALSGLIGDGTFRAVPAATIARLRGWAEQPALRKLIEATATLVHGDPNGDNVFLAGEELRVIDWQRPRIAPRDVDTAALLHGSGIDPYVHVCPQAVQLFFFLRLNWFVACKTTYFPPGTTYERQSLDAIARLFQQR